MNESSKTILMTLIENPKSLAVVCGAATLIVAFIGMSVPSNPEPPKSPAEVQAEVLKSSQENMLSCIENAMNNIASSDHTPAVHEKIVAACTSAFSAVKDKVGSAPVQPDKS